MGRSRVSSSGCRRIGTRSSTCLRSRASGSPRAPTEIRTRTSISAVTTTVHNGAVHRVAAHRQKTPARRRVAAGMMAGAAAAAAAGAAASEAQVRVAASRRRSARGFSRFFCSQLTLTSASGPSRPAARPVDQARGRDGLPAMQGLSRDRPQLLAGLQRRCDRQLRPGPFRSVCARTASGFTLLLGRGRRTEEDLLAGRLQARSAVSLRSRGCSRARPRWTST